MPPISKLLPEWMLKAQGTVATRPDAVVPDGMPVIRIGYLPLTDCAPLVVAHELGLDHQHGIHLELIRESSWSVLRDRLVSGELDAAHALYGMVYGIHLGVGSVQREMAILMGLNSNGQAITLSSRLASQGVRTGANLADRIRTGSRRLVFAQTFPTGTHAMWLYYWLASLGIHPLEDVDMLTIPPQRMVTALQQQQLDGFCAGEPWNALAADQAVGFTVVTSQQIWPDHPEKVLATCADWADVNPALSRTLVTVMLEAARYADVLQNREEIANWLAQPAYLNVASEIVRGRLLGQYSDGLGKQWDDPHGLAFFDQGRVNFPWVSDGIWFMTQLKRWGLLRSDPDYGAVANRLHRIDTYRQACQDCGVPVPDQIYRPVQLLDGLWWDGLDPAAYEASFAIHSRHGVTL